MDATARFIFEGAIDDQRRSAVSISDGKETASLLARFVHRDAESFSFQIASWPDYLNKDGSHTAAFEFGTNDGAVKFESQIQAMQPQAGVLLVRCGLPGKVGVVQRRAHFRVPVPTNSPFGLTAWKVPPHWVLRDRPKPSAQLRFEIIDLSLGGLAMKVFPNRLNPEPVASGDRIRLELHFDKSEAVVDSNVAHCSAPSSEGVIRAGLAFQKMETSFEGRRASFLLDRVIATLQRNAIKEISAVA